MIALLRRRADEPPEHRRERRMRDRELPVHPTAGPRTRARISGLELAGAVFRREVAHDRVRFPQQEAVLFERRHQAVGIHGEVGGLLVLAERTADVDALVRPPELADRPHHLLHVDRGVAPPDLDHGSALRSLVMAAWLSRAFIASRGQKTSRASRRKAADSGNTFKLQNSL